MVVSRLLTIRIQINSSEYVLARSMLLGHLFDPTASGGYMADADLKSPFPQPTLHTYSTLLLPNFDAYSATKL